ncbi:MAG: methylglyoxal synthase [Pseudomonadota bacterium]
MNFGLASHKLHLQGADSALLKWARTCEPAAEALGLRLQVAGAACEVLEQQHLLQGRLTALGRGREGGLMRLVSRIAGGLRPGDELDGIFFFIDPVDPTSLYPEAQALKRQCVIHGKPFVATLAGAIEWIGLELSYAGQPETILPRPDGQTIALIAHDALKTTMVDFAGEFFDLLSRFATRVATGTTGSLLNNMAWSRGWPASRPWVTPYQSGPLGGDAQIAELILDGQCQKVIFFEDPHVARQHEADIQLLERAVYSTSAVSCFTTPAMSRRWAGSPAWRASPA